GEPRVTDLAAVRARARGTRMPGGPRPAFDVEETARTHHGPVGDPHRGKGERGAGLTAGQRALDVTRHLRSTLRHGTPLVTREVATRSGREPRNVGALERLEPHMSAVQHRLPGVHG